MRQTASMINASNKLYSPIEYLKLKGTLDLSKEHFYSDWLSVANTTKNHQLIASNLVNIFAEHLKNNEAATVTGQDDAPPYLLYSDGVRFEAIKDRFYPSPDLFITQYPDEDCPVGFKREPLLAVEVLSKITDEFDRHCKLKKYMQVPTLQVYLMVSQYTFRVELYTRSQTSAPWGYENFDALESLVSIPLINLETTVAEIYHNTGIAPKAFPPPKK